MGTVTERRSRNGGASTWCAQIRRKAGGRVVFSVSQTFAREAAAKAWLKKKEQELDRPGALDRAIAAAKGPKKPARQTLDDAIARLIEESEREIKKTKAQVLRATREDEIARMECEDIRSEHLVAFAKRLLDGGREPSTVGNYMSHLSGLFSIARPAWGFRLDAQAMADAMTVCKRLGYTAKSSQRERRPSLEELDRLMAYFLDAWQRRPRSVPMHRVTAFAIFSMRRQAEICRLTWKDLGVDRTMVRKMKHPGSAVGRDTETLITPEARAIAMAMPAVDDRIFPFNPDTVSTAFTRACKELEIEDLHFHDLRHDGISWLSEQNVAIQIVKAHSGHRTSASLDRYTNIEKVGDKYADWKWLPIVTEPVTTASAGAPSERPRAGRRYKQQDRAGGRRGTLSGSSPSS